jgi:aspartate/glutamate racemase
MLSRTEPDVKRIGLIGGLSPESTAHYYQILCREYNLQFRQLNFPEITIESLNLQALVRLFEVIAFAGIRAPRSSKAQRLKRSWKLFGSLPRCALAAHTRIHFWL